MNKLWVNIVWIFGVCLLLSACQKDEPVTTSSVFWESEEVATLPIIFHIVHRGEAVGSEGNISAQVIQEYLLKMNKDFRNYTKDPKAVDIKVQFRLATYNPDGVALAEAGIDRILKADYTALSIDDNDLPMLMETQWNPNKYINVWVVETTSSAGPNTISWTNRFPVATASNPLEGLTTIPDDAADTYIPPTADGIILANNVFGQNMIDNEGIILSHEMGHFLGLFHVFAEAPATCQDYSDYCSDTYKYDRMLYDKSGVLKSSRTTCSGTVVSADNIMDYAVQSAHRFTQDQMKRMRKILTYSPQRKQLRSSSAYYVQSNNSEPIVDTFGVFYPKQKPIR